MITLIAATTPCIPLSSKPSAFRSPETYSVMYVRYTLTVFSRLGVIGCWTFDPPKADKCLLASGELDVHLYNLGCAPLSLLSHPVNDNSQFNGLLLKAILK